MVKIIKINLKNNYTLQNTYTLYKLVPLLEGSVLGGKGAVKVR